MKRRIVLLAATTLATFGGAAALVADETAFPSSGDSSSPVVTQASSNSAEQRLVEIEAELAALKRRLGQEESPTAECSPCRCDPCCRSQGLIAGAALTLLKPHHSMGIRGFDGTDLTFDLEPAPRVWLGYGWNSGLGVRTTYWGFDQLAAGPSVLPERTDLVSFDTYVLDFEVTDTTPLGSNWDATLSAGLRYVDYEETRLWAVPKILQHSTTYGRRSAIQQRKNMPCSSSGS